MSRLAGRQAHWLIKNRLLESYSLTIWDVRSMSLGCVRARLCVEYRSGLATMRSGFLWRDRAAGCRATVEVLMEEHPMMRDEWDESQSGFKTIRRGSEKFSRGKS